MLQLFIYNTSVEILHIKVPPHTSDLHEYIETSLKHILKVFLQINQK
jgi:hypothetical protein